SAWYEQSRFSAAELQSDDIARFVLPGGGPHKVGLRVSLADGAPQFVELGVVDIALVPGGDTVRVSSAYDADAVRAAVEAARDGK
ncbi:MAG: hypothetical protein VYA51_08915, partial [Planctomycetota bacterium]|nr:hypothetical protein [Planctomycetota bacterium]